LDIYKFGVIFKSSLGCVSLSEIRWWRGHWLYIGIHNQKFKNQSNE
jgi:hypothetical protein